MDVHFGSHGLVTMPYALACNMRLKDAKTPPAAADEGYRLGCFFADYFGHSPVFPKSPALSSGTSRAAMVASTRRHAP